MGDDLRAAAAASKDGAPATADAIAEQLVHEVWERSRTAMPAAVAVLGLSWF